jgi:preprotein translocase subunit SecY
LLKYNHKLRRKLKLLKRGINMWFVIFVLAIILMFLGVFSIFGDTLQPKKGAGWGTLSIILAGIYTWLLTSWINFVTHIIEPAWETLQLERRAGVYELGAIILLIGLAFYILMMTRTAYISWYKKGIIELSWTESK